MKIIKPAKKWKILSEKAWKIRENAFIYGNTKVGVALLSLNGFIYQGCNVEHLFRSHDIHAEVNAITSMVANGERNIDKMLIATKRKFFTPCGACMDWIMQFSAEESLIGFQSEKGGDIQVFSNNELMPYYPK